MSETIVYPLPRFQIGGAEQQLLELVRGLDKQQFHPIVAVLHGGGPLESEFRSIPGVEIIEINRGGKADITPILRLAKLLRLRRARIVQPYLSPTTAFGALAGLLAGTPIRIMTERSGMGRHMSFYVRLQDRLTPFATCVVANSEAGRVSLIQRGVPAHKIKVIVNGINRDRLRVNRSIVDEFRARLSVPEGGKVVGILASLLPVKRHDVFLRAAATLSQRHPGARFAIFGDGILRSELEQMVVSLGIADRVVLFGNQRQVAECLSACDLLVSASRVEGLSNSILEAMALDVPVVATDIPGTQEIVHDRSTGYLVPVGDDRQLADTIDYAFSHPEETARYTARAREMIDTRFSLQRMVADHVALYTSLLQPRRVALRAAEG